MDWEGIGDREETFGSQEGLSEEVNMRSIRI